MSVNRIEGMIGKRQPFADVTFDRLKICKRTSPAFTLNPIERVRGKIKRDDFMTRFREEQCVFPRAASKIKNPFR